MRRMTRYTPILLLLGLLAWWLPDQAQAQCRAYASPQTYANGDSMGHLDCDLSGNLRVTGGGTATAAAPTYTEGAQGAFSFDLSGNLRVTLGTLLSGEDPANYLLMTSGGVVRQTQILGTGGVPSTATDATTTPQILPTGRKTFTGRITCTGTCVQTQKIYGTWRSTADNTLDDLICTIVLNKATADQASCPPTETNFSYWYVTTSLTSGTTPLAGIFVQY
jgi:hypothetical protein